MFSERIHSSGPPDGTKWGPGEVSLFIRLFTAAYSEWWLGEGFPFNGVTKVHMNINSKGQTFPQYSVCGSFTTSAADITVTKKKNLVGSYMMGWDWSPKKKKKKSQQSAQTENIHSQAHGWACCSQEDAGKNMIYPHTKYTPRAHTLSEGCRCTAVSESLHLRYIFQNFLNIGNSLWWAFREFSGEKFWFSDTASASNKWNKQAFFVT